MALISVADLETRLGRALDAAETAQAEAFIEDASALVMDIARTDFVNAETGAVEVPPAIVPVIVAMVRRALENPLGRTGENLGDYGWQMNVGGVSPATLFSTKREIRTIRRAVGQPRYGTVPLEAPMPTGYAPTSEVEIL